MTLIFVSHDRDFIWKERGYKNVWEMNKDFIQKWNSKVTSDDIIYHLGDVMLGDMIEGLRCLHQLNGSIHIIRGNHDTNNKVEEYLKSYNVIDIKYADMIKAGKYNFYLSHYPTMVANYHDVKKLWNISGHTHSTDPFQLYQHQIYNVAVDAHAGFPVGADEIIEDIKRKRGII